MAFLLVLLLFTNSFAQDVAVPFDSERWTMTNARQVDHLGRRALLGTAFLKDVEFTDGVIEVDMAVDRRTSYPGVVFRVSSPREHERVYIRPHRAGLYTDAIQYVASFNGVDSWQLYNGPGKTAALEIPYGTWFHVKIEVKGSRARVFVNDADQPAIEINELHWIVGLRQPTGLCLSGGYLYALDRTSLHKISLRQHCPILVQSADA